MDILVIYQFCSFGGVERVLLNRALAFNSHDLKVVISVGYLQDFGALDSFKRYIQANHLEKNILPFILPSDFSFDQTKYDLIQIIDTPQVLGKTIASDSVFIECHTPYIENRQYLKELPKNIKGIIVPSKSFRSLLMAEFPELLDIFVLPNPIPDEFFGMVKTPNIYRKRPLTYLSRIDTLKNFYEAIQIFKSVQDREDIFQIVIGQGESLKHGISLLEQEHLMGNTLLRDKILFEKVPSLINLVRQHRGVFISPSKGESFGLSAAEFICGGIPVLLSDIPAHQELVNHDDRFLYPLGNIDCAREKLISLLVDWDAMSTTVTTYGDKFKNASFIKNWYLFLQKYGYSNK